VKSGIGNLVSKPEKPPRFEDDRGGSIDELDGVEDTEVPANLNDNLPWSTWDIEDIEWGIEHGESIKGIADFLCRTESEVRAKAMEMGMLEDAIARRQVIIRGEANR
jgi:hypothetical protein